MDDRIEMKVFRDAHILKPMATLMAARECSAGPIAMLGIGRDHKRFELDREFGVDFTVNIEQEDPLEAVPELLGGPPDVVVET
jgi:threonine dehydrogenase-like Zn-dependent dehydrogenase